MSFYKVARMGGDREPQMAVAEPSKRLTRDQCLAKAKECRDMARSDANAEY
jgi:hypothetical protein